MRRDKGNELIRTNFIKIGIRIINCFLVILCAGRFDNQPELDPRKQFPKSLQQPRILPTWDDSPSLSPSILSPRGEILLSKAINRFYRKPPRSRTAP